MTIIHPTCCESYQSGLGTAQSSIEELVMKIGIIGAGAVGSACALALVMRGAAREVMLVDRTRERARAVATDLRYGAPLSPLVDIRDGDFNDLTGAALVMVTAGVNEKTGGATDRDLLFEAVANLASGTRPAVPAQKYILGKMVHQ
jgi:malate/lactate dehydrogenase